MTINVLNSYIFKLAAISIPLAEVIDPLMKRGMSIDEVAEHLRVALIALDAEQVRKGKLSADELRDRLGFEPLEAVYIMGSDGYDHYYGLQKVNK